MCEKATGAFASASHSENEVLFLRFTPVQADRKMTRYLQIGDFCKFPHDQRVVVVRKGAIQEANISPWFQ